MKKWLIVLALCFFVSAACAWWGYAKGKNNAKVIEVEKIITELQYVPVEVIKNVEVPVEVIKEVPSAAGIVYVKGATEYVDRFVDRIIEVPAECAGVVDQIKPVPDDLFASATVSLIKVNKRPYARIDIDLGVHLWDGSDVIGSRTLDLTKTQFSRKLLQQTKKAKFFPRHPRHWRLGWSAIVGTCKPFADISLYSNELVIPSTWDACAAVGWGGQF